jgi:uncharacterized protein (DUF433 family)
LFEPIFKTRRSGFFDDERSVRFMDDFPSVKKEQIEAVIELAKLAVVA